MKKVIVLFVKLLGRFKFSWRIFYRVVVMLPNSRRIIFWEALTRHGIVARMCDEGFYKISTLVNSGERYALPGRGGGINSVIRWQQLNWKSDLPEKCADKFAVREFVRERIGGNYLIPLVPSEESFWTDVRQIDFSKFPNSFVLKLNNGSGMNLLVPDKSKLNIEAAIQKMTGWLKTDFSKRFREYHYGKIVNKIICETMIGADGVAPVDYKFMCSNGRVLFVQIESDRFIEHRQNFYDVDFNPLNVRGGYKKARHKLSKPDKWNEMLSVAENLSTGIPIVRVDLYFVLGKVYFGEMTFTPAAAMKRYEPISFSIGIGKLIDLKPFM